MSETIGETLRFSVVTIAAGSRGNIWMNMQTVAGILAILFWSTNVAFSRRVAEQLGVLTSGAIMFSAAGVLSLACQWAKDRSLGFRGRSSPRYILICGALFVVNVTSLQLAIGLAASRTQTIIVGLVNYLWPTFGLVLAPVFLGKKVRWFLPVGLAAACGGMFLASTRGEVLRAGEVLTQPRALAAYGLALTAAVTWGVYSNLSRKWAGEQESSPAPLFMFTSGLLMACIRLFVHESGTPTPAAPYEMAYMIIFPTTLAFVFWDAAMRRGRMILVVSLSYFIPLLSTIISSVRLEVSPGPELWLAACLIIVGAMICRAAVVER